MLNPQENPDETNENLQELALGSLCKRVDDLFTEFLAITVKFSSQISS